MVRSVSALRALLFALLAVLVSAAPAVAQEGVDAGAVMEAPAAGGDFLASIVGPEAALAVKLLFKAVIDKDTPVLVKVGLALVALVALLRYFATRKRADGSYVLGRVGGFFDTHDGGSVLLFSLSLLGGFGSALGAGQPFTWSLVGTCAMVAMTTTGGWQMFLKPLWERIVSPLLARLFAPKTAPSPTVE